MQENRKLFTLIGLGVGGGGVRKVPAPFLNFENFLDI